MKRGPTRSHIFRNRSSARKQLRQLKKRRSRSGCMGAPGKYDSSSVNPAGTGRRGFEECTTESGITMARVHDDIWEMKRKGRRMISGGIEGQASRGNKLNRLRFTRT